jgi:hypothetical protein
MFPPSYAAAASEAIPAPSLILQSSYRYFWVSKGGKRILYRLGSASTLGFPAAGGMEEGRPWPQSIVAWHTPNANLGREKVL